jgi:hypothetical protein
VNLETAEQKIKELQEHIGKIEDLCAEVREIEETHMEEEQDFPAMECEVGSIHHLAFAMRGDIEMLQNKIAEFKLKQ